jgi:CHAD domain-containing protein
MAKPKIIAGIDCDEVALQGIREVLNSRFKEMCDLRSEALDWTNPAGVHDMRVASRRLRSALTDFMPYVRKRFLDHSLKDMKGIGDALGEVRDLDVAIGSLENLAGKTPDDVRNFLSEIVEEQKTSRRKKRKDLKQVLRRTQLKQIESDFAAAVDSATSEPQRKKRVSGEMSYEKLGRSILVGHVKEIEKLSKGLYQPFDVESLHTLRIAFKGLRYSVEIFEPCWGRHLTTFAKRAAGLQTSLGKLHDCDVWIESFGERLSRAKSQENKSDAIVWLLRHFVGLRTKHFKDTLGLWRKWETDGLSIKLAEHLNIKILRE